MNLLVQNGQKGRSMERRLAAILAADVVGYSRLMEHDEVGTLAALKSRRREILQPAVSKHHGRIVKLMGDGVLVEFGSAVNAVACAVELQQAMAAANADQPEDRHVVLRIGINLGDVMVEGSDLYGDGVNIAARLEGLAEPGRILVSGITYDYVKNKVSAGFDDLGTQTLKNIAEPVRTYRVTPSPRASVAAAGAPIDKPSIAVLPFTNMSGDVEQEYLSDGITEDIITELSRFRDLFVIARNSSFQYRGKAVDVRRVARELGVQYVIEGSVRKASDRLRITGQLIEASSGNHLWSERYDRDFDDVFAVQDDVVQMIVGTIMSRLESAGVERSRLKPTANLVAYDHILRANAELRAVLAADAYARRRTTHARTLIDRALALDPSFARAYAALAFAHLIEWYYLGKEDDVDKAYVSAKSAIAFDSDDDLGHVMMGHACTYAKKHEEAIAHIEQALALNANDAEAMRVKGIYLSFIGRHDEAIAWFQNALRLNPFQRDLCREDLGMASYAARRYQEAANAFNSIDRRPHWIHAHLAAAYAKLGRTNDARAEIVRLQPWPAPWDIQDAEKDVEFPNVPKALIAYLRCYRDPETFLDWIDGFRRAGLPV
jgi:adenylate cyclase